MFEEEGLRPHVRAIDIGSPGNPHWVKSGDPVFLKGTFEQHKIKLLRRDKLGNIIVDLETCSVRPWDISPTTV